MKSTKGSVVIFVCFLFLVGLVFVPSISPWTRDVAQDIDHHDTIFDFLGRTLKILLDRDKNMSYK